ncbi:hypothetical protein NDU88_007648 [Pleurodeles waltl]|uniref:Uncharacterized protein n=1 Tax=Pleurodeles waltl TaxID=8319 RepID=A0AAV7VUF0_PLEWA|nr:hypothetical protein NDU88_007648 [Pleurodeles waltl]
MGLCYSLRPRLFGDPGSISTATASDSEQPPPELSCRGGGDRGLPVQNGGGGGPEGRDKPSPQQLLYKSGPKDKQQLKSWEKLRLEEKEAEKEAKKVSKSIDRVLKEQKREYKQTHRLLLLGRYPAPLAPALSGQPRPTGPGAVLCAAPRPARPPCVHAEAFKRYLCNRGWGFEPACEYGAVTDVMPHIQISSNGTSPSSKPGFVERGKMRTLEHSVPNDSLSAFEMSRASFPFATPGEERSRRAPGEPQLIDMKCAGAPWRRLIAPEVRLHREQHLCRLPRRPGEQTGLKSSPLHRLPD